LETNAVPFGDPALLLRLDSSKEKLIAISPRHPPPSSLRVNETAARNGKGEMFHREQPLLTDLAFATLTAMQRVQFDIV
jgi:hypothetical protein